MAFPPENPNFAIIAIAQRVSNKTVENSEDGLTDAIAILQQQHQEVMPPHTPDEFAILIKQREPIKVAEQFGSSALSMKDWTDAIHFGNWLFAFSSVETAENLGDLAFNTCLKYHRQLAHAITQDFSNQDPYLKTSWDKIEPDIKHRRQVGDEAIELTLLRGVVHMVAFNGTLGEQAQKNFDPLAVVQI